MYVITLCIMWHFSSLITFLSLHSGSAHSLHEVYSGIRLVTASIRHNRSISKLLLANSTIWYIVSNLLWFEIQCMYGNFSWSNTNRWVQWSEVLDILTLIGLFYALTILPDWCHCPGNVHKNCCSNCNVRHMLSSAGCSIWQSILSHLHCTCVRN